MLITMAEGMQLVHCAGETMHVDFGCLFDRGLLLEIPEMVPFRLVLLAR